VVLDHSQRLGVDKLELIRVSLCVKMDCQNKFVNASESISALVIGDNEAASFLDVLLELHGSKVSRELDAFNALEGIEVLVVLNGE
jgi:hypothetical protein